MKSTRWAAVALLTVAALGDRPAFCPGQEDAKVEVKIVKLEALKDLIKQQKGKVVVVDFWADT